MQGEEQGIFLGYDKGSPAYIVYFPETQAIKRCHIVRFSDKFKIENDAPKQPQVVIEEQLIVNIPPSTPDTQNDSIWQKHVEMMVDELLSKYQRPCWKYCL